LEKELSQLFGSTAKPVAAKATKKKRKMSAAGKARIVAAQKARWAKINAAKSAGKTVKAAKPAKKKFRMSAAAKAKISAAMKARWAKVKAEKKK
jgi:fibronectin type 3 domain-containing protein